MSSSSVTARTTWHAAALYNKHVQLNTSIHMLYLWCVQTERCSCLWYWWLFFPMPLFVKIFPPLTFTSAWHLSLALFSLLLSRSILQQLFTQSCKSISTGFMWKFSWQSYTIATIDACVLSQTTTVVCVEVVLACTNYQSLVTYEKHTPLTHMYIHVGLGCSHSQHCGRHVWCHLPPHQVCNQWRKS